MCIDTVGVQFTENANILTMSAKLASLYEFQVTVLLTSIATWIALVVWILVLMIVIIPFRLKYNYRNQPIRVHGSRRKTVQNRTCLYSPAADTGNSYRKISGTSFHDTRTRNSYKSTGTSCWYRKPVSLSWPLGYNYCKSNCGTCTLSTACKLDRIVRIQLL
jgi:hypothetical protein